MEGPLSLEQFKALALQYHASKMKKDIKKKTDEDFYTYVLDRSNKIKKRCGYFK